MTGTFIKKVSVKGRSQISLKCSHYDKWLGENDSILAPENPQIYFKEINRKFILITREYKSVHKVWK